MQRDRLIRAVEDYLAAESYDANCPDDVVERSRARKELQRVREQLRREVAAASALTGGEETPIVRRILVAVDDSEPAKWAVHAASRLAQEMSASLAIVHVIDSSVAAIGAETPGGNAAWLDQLREHGEQVLLRTRALVPSNLELECLIRDGTPAREIVAVAEQYGADLIVIGTHSRGKVARFFLGSTAEAVVRHAPCMVLTVGHDPFDRLPPSIIGRRANVQLACKR